MPGQWRWSLPGPVGGRKCQTEGRSETPGEREKRNFVEEEEKERFLVKGREGRERWKRKKE